MALFPIGDDETMHVLAGAQPLPGFLNSLASPLDHYGYWAIGVFLLLESIGVPVVPGETALIAGAIFAGSGRAGLNIVVVAIAAAIASFAGAEIGYLIGRLAGREIVLKFGKYVLIKSHHLDRAEAMVSSYGGIVVVLARYIPVLREANGIIAGITQMRWHTFTIFNAIGVCAWVASWVTIGGLAGNHIDTIYTDVERSGTYLLAALAVLVIGYVGYRLLRKRQRPAPARPDAPSAEKSAPTIIDLAEPQGDGCGPGGTA